MTPIEYIFSTYLYLYKRCKEHPNCFTPNHKDDLFYNECVFISKNTSWCMVDVVDKLLEIKK